MRLSFQSKVLLPVLSILVGLMALTTWLIDQRLNRQFEADAQERLATSAKVFKAFQGHQTESLLLRYRNLPNEPRVRALSFKPDAATWQRSFNDLLLELNSETTGPDAILVTSALTNLQATLVARPSQFNVPRFTSATAECIQAAISSRAPIEKHIALGNAFYDVISVPVDVGGQVTAVLTFATEVGEAYVQKVRQLTGPGSEIVFLAGTNIVLSTLRSAAQQNEFAALVQQRAGSNGVVVAGPSKALLGGEHFYWQAMPLDTGGASNNFNYVLLSSYEQPYRALRETQSTLMYVRFCAVALAGLILWALIRKVTQPLRELRDGAEAVGRGDFTRKVRVATSDELGDLSRTFNKMTDSLNASRTQLEQTVSTLQTTRAQLVQSEKLSVIGEFVAGVAHELNNPLTGVVGYAQLLNDSEVDLATQKNYSRRIVQSAIRCQRIVQNLLSFARQHPPERRQVSLNDLLETVVDLLQYELRTSNIEVVKQFAPDLPKIMADGHQLQQVFLNLINNARQAMEGRPGSRITLTTSVAGKSIHLALEDNGPGIPQAHLSRIFDPFFTTKEVGKGTGLGLSLSYGIIQEHGGSISVRTAEGEGATFLIELPITQQEPPPVRATEGGLAIPSGFGAGKRLLAVDDEEHILQFTKDVLQAEGYKVDTALDGAAALKALRKQAYDLILCDLKMPGISGQEFYEQVLADDAAAARRILFMTGDVMSASTDQFLKRHEKRCVPKPFSPTDLRAAVYESSKISM